MRLWVARRVQRMIAVNDGERGLMPPTSDKAVRVIEEDGTSHLLLSHGDSLELVTGTDDAGYTAFTISPRAALKLGWFLIWTYWLRGLWFGWKLGAWEWVAEVEQDEKILAALAIKSKRIHDRHYPTTPKSSQVPR